MSTGTTHAEDAVDLFAGEYAGVRLGEDEFGRWTAYGHVSGEDMAAGMRAYMTEFGYDGYDEAETENGTVPVDHVWAVLKHADDAADDEGWFFSWRDVTEATPGAFPLTAVPSP